VYAATLEGSMTYLRSRWDGLRPHQRELTWTVVFGLSGLGVLILVGLVVGSVWPALMNDPSYSIPVTAVGVLAGLGSSTTAQLLGYRLEDRHEKKESFRG
jgi:hypothetical protein